MFFNLFIYLCSAFKNTASDWISEGKGLKNVYTRGGHYCGASPLRFYKGQSRFGFATSAGISANVNANLHPSD
jgi:hypothetical protein